MAAQLDSQVSTVVATEGTPTPTPSPELSSQPGVSQQSASSPITAASGVQRPSQSPPPASTAAIQDLNLSELPPIFISATHIGQDELFELEDDVSHHHGRLTYDLGEARIVISKVRKKARIQLDLKAKGVWTEEITTAKSHADALVSSSLGKRKRESRGLTAEDVIDSDGRSDMDNQIHDRQDSASRSTSYVPCSPTSSMSLFAEDNILVVSLDWFFKSKEAGSPLPLTDYLTLEAKRISVPKPDSDDASPPATILARAKADVGPDRTSIRHNRYQTVRAKQKSPTTTTGRADRQSQHAHLVKTTTSEYDSSASDIPKPPTWVQQGIKYACQRSTPADTPNDTFITLLRRIRLARELTADEIGVRAYSTSIAAIAAYPHKLSHPTEVLRLPGCDAKIANLFVEFANTGSLQAVRDIETNEELQVLERFYDIWGVGASMAREFFFKHGWRELDDIVEFGWAMLSRVQQIGVKFYSEFLDPIPRSEVEDIATMVHRHACRVRNDRMQSLIVGGYRRGKAACGDVDILLSHPDESQTLNLAHDVVASLEEDEWITHTLLLSLNGSNRDQQTLPFRANHAGGGGFDSLDKALVVWQNPDWPSKATDVAAAASAGTAAGNPNIHRRVDIIIAPWRSVGCAVTGWSGGTTFQRDLRRYAKNVKGWKFDSSGVRSRRDGGVVDLEGWESGESGRAKTMQEAERRVFKGMGLAFVPPTERCTG